MCKRESLVIALEDFCLLLERGEFFEAHEVLEEAWHPLRKSKDPLARSVKGLINAAIAFEHLKRNRPKAKRVAKITMDSYERRVGSEICLQKAIEKVESLRKEWYI